MTKMSSRFLSVIGRIKPLIIRSESIVVKRSQLILLLFRNWHSPPVVDCYLLISIIPCSAVLCYFFILFLPYFWGFKALLHVGSLSSKDYYKDYYS